MPNWVNNVIYIHGENEKAVREFTDFLSQPYKGEDTGSINFLNLVAPPDEHWEAYNCGPVSTEMAQTNRYNWYDWNVANWGTKWNASDGDGWEFTTDVVGTAARVQFSTAWSPPYGVIEALWEKCKALNFEITYSWEEEQGFGEEWESVNGELEMTREWSIPESHAEFDAQGRTCVCDWEDDPEYWFPDCPKIELDATV